MAATPVTYKAQNSLRKACYKSNGLAVQSISLDIKPADMTDGTSTSGYVDFATGALPASCIVLGWKAVTTAAWDDDTTAIIEVGISGTVDLYSSTTSGSIATTGTVGSVVKTTGVYYQTAAATPRVTITGGSDFTAFVTAATPRTTVYIYYILLP
jgi:hypothetical protein